jgi:hypothetical protein
MEITPGPINTLVATTQAGEGMGGAKCVRNPCGGATTGGAEGPALGGGGGGARGRPLQRPYVRTSCGYVRIRRQASYAYTHTQRLVAWRAGRRTHTCVRPYACVVCLHMRTLLYAGDACSSLPSRVAPPESARTSPSLPSSPGILCRVTCAHSAARFARVLGSGGTGVPLFVPAPPDEGRAAGAQPRAGAHSLARRQMQDIQPRFVLAPPDEGRRRASQHVPARIR